MLKQYLSHCPNVFTQSAHSINVLCVALNIQEKQCFVFFSNNSLRRSSIPPKLVLCENVELLGWFYLFLPHRIHWQVQDGFEQWQMCCELIYAKEDGGQTTICLQYWVSGENLIKLLTKFFITEPNFGLKDYKLQMVKKRRKSRKPIVNEYLILYLTV